MTLFPARSVKLTVTVVRVPLAATRVPESSVMAKVAEEVPSETTTLNALPGFSGVITPKVSFSVVSEILSLALNDPVGTVLLGPPNPMTITYRTAARTTVIATIRMVAMTGETPERFFHIFFIIFSPPLLVDLATVILELFPLVISISMQIFSWDNNFLHR